MLLLADPIDEFWLPTTPTYQDKPFRSLTRGDVDLSKIEGEAKDGEAASAEQEAVPGAEMDRLIALFKTQLGERVKDVRPSARLTDSAVCLVADEQSLDMRLERFLKQHQQLDELSKRVLEINPKHALIRRMAALAADARPARRARRSRGAAARSGAHRRGRAAARPGRVLAPHERVPGQGPRGLAIGPKRLG